VGTVRLIRQAGPTPMHHLERLSPTPYTTILYKDVTIAVWMRR